MRKPMALACLALAACAPAQLSEAKDLKAGHWRASLECPGGEIPFGLKLEQEKPNGEWRGWVINGSEEIEIGSVAWDGRELSLRFDPYDSSVKASYSKDGRSLTGEWTRYIRKGKEVRLPFRATAGRTVRFPVKDSAGEVAASLAAQYKVQFSEDKNHSIGLFQSTGEGPEVQATFLTTLGDYRYLDGALHGDHLQLSCFDGAHAFLFKATVEPNGNLKGEFWSRDSWHETWTGVPDEDVEMPDPFGLSKMIEEVPFDSLSFPDTDGNKRLLSDSEFQGKARLIVLFGTWCPNCNDETDYLVELDKQYGDRGLSILGLAFEFGNDFERNARIVREYAEHHQAEFPMLIAGTSDKAKASEAFPSLDKVRAYPTTLFVDARGKVQAVYTGFSGPATGAYHERLKEAFERQIDALLRP